MLKYLFMPMIIFSTIFSMYKKEIKETTHILAKIVVNDESSSDVDDMSRCSICFERYNNKEIKKRVDILCDEQRKIYHRYCKQCITDWVLKDMSCPICRRPIKPNVIGMSNFSYIFACLQQICCCCK